MQLQLVRTTGRTRQLREIVEEFTPPMRRVCRHMSDGALREMVERMATHQLAEEQRRRAPLRRHRTTPTDRVYGPRQAC